MNPALESSIADHLVVPRTLPARKAAFRPPNPAYSARFSPEVVEVVMAYFGVQHRQDADAATVARARAELDDLAARLAGTDGAGQVDRARYVDEAGYTTTVLLAYWVDPERHARWSLSGTSWTDPARRADGLGFFTELLTPSMDRMETLLSSDRREGVSALADSMSGQVREHGYWGSARDRLPISQVDALAPEGTPARDGTGAGDRPGLVRVMPHHNLCVIRSGQNWAETTGDERTMYLREVEPVLRAGMDFLRDDGREIGCYVNRYMTVLDEDWQPTERTFGLSLWHSIEDLEEWAAHHPTHLAIFAVAMRYLNTMAGAATLRLSHEVTVASAGQQHFEYLDCHPATGMLRAAR